MAGNLLIILYVWYQLNSICSLNALLSMVLKFGKKFEYRQPETDSVKTISAGIYPC